MSMESKVVEGKARPLGKYPHIKRAGDFLFISGTSARQADDSIAGWDIRSQTHAVIANLRDILAGADATLADLVEVTTFLISMADFKGYNEVYGEYFDYDGPVRTTVAVRELPHWRLLIEMRAVAWKPLAAK
jgi:2-aminomuconate deaminase